MTRNSEVREFLVSRRARITPQQAEPDTPTAQALGFLASWATTQQAEADSRR